MKKIIYFLQNGRSSIDDISRKAVLESKGDKVIFSNGSLPNGFQDSCDAVVLKCDFPHVKEWAESAGIDILSFDKKEEKPESQEEKETKKPEPEKVELEKPTARRGRKPKSEEGDK